MLAISRKYCLLPKFFIKSGYSVHSVALINSHYFILIKPTLSGSHNNYHVLVFYACAGWFGVIAGA